MKFIARGVRPSVFVIYSSGRSHEKDYSHRQTLSTNFLTLINIRASLGVLARLTLVRDAKVGASNVGVVIGISTFTDYSSLLVLHSSSQYK